MKKCRLIALLLALVLTVLSAAALAEEEEFYYFSTKQRPDLYLFGEEVDPLFEDGGRLFYVSSMTLVIGEERAALIDSGYGQGDLMAQIRQFTDLPVVLVLTHGDGDHWMGAYQFEGCDIYMNSADYEMTLEGQEKSGKYFKPTHDLQEGDVIDLGGTTLEAINVKGHTDGSIVLWDRLHNSLYTGDAVNRRPWVFLERSVPLEGYLDDLLRLHRMTEKAMPTIYCNHSIEPYPYRVLTDTIQACSEVLLGKAEGIPYRSPIGPEGELYANSFEYTVGLVRLCYNVNDLFYQK